MLKAIKKSLPLTSKVATDDQIPFLFEQTTDLFISLSSDLTISNINPAVAALFSDKQKKCIGKKYHELFGADKALCALLGNRQRLISKLKKLDHQPLLQVSFIWDSHITWLINALWQKSGELKGLVLIGHKDDESKITVQKAKDEKFMLETMIAYLPGNVYWMDRNCIHIGCNNNVLKMLGMTREQYIGTTYEELAEIAGWENGEAESFRKDDLEVLRTGIAKFDVEEPPLRHVDGSVLYYLTTRVPMKNEAGDVVGVAGISIDIGRLKKAQAELREAKEEAEIANRAKTEFIASMSHDLRTPLQAILMMTEVLQKKSQIPELKKPLDAINKAGNELMQLVEAVLNFSKLESGKQELHMEMFNLQQLVEDIVELMEHSAQQKNLQLIVQYSAEVPLHLVNDVAAIRRILFNLLNNAIKFTERGSVQLVVNVFKIENDIVLLQFKVSDTGIGIPSDKLESIFERFSRVESVHKKRYEGIGLGLAIVKQLVQSLGGQIQVSSELSKGSEFICLLPFRSCL